MTELGPNTRFVPGLADPISRPGSARPSQGAQQGGGAQQGQFARVLAGEAGGAGQVSFSNHALQRLQRRGLSMEADQVQRLSEGVQLAAAKGSRNSVVLVDDLAFVVAVPSRTVVTAIDRAHMKEQVFTNIDSAVIA